MWVSMYAAYEALSDKMQHLLSGLVAIHGTSRVLALSAYRANDAAAARKWLDMIELDGETPPSLRSRAEALQALLPPVAKS